ncbi:TRAM domain-containing protein [Candidatus Woesearchaeota archaeon]|nr:TRAM domain-containing protein [Candidatus Woesearchaeota archaeon]
MKPKFFQDQAPPIAVGEEHTGIIASVGEKGDGVLRIKGFVVFVPGVEKGDFVKIKITKVLPKVSFGELIEKLKEPAKEDFLPKPKPKPKDPAEDVSHLLTTEGDSEDFGEEDD